MKRMAESMRLVRNNEITYRKNFLVKVLLLKRFLVFLLLN
jgi:hypothetical protein